jgi:lysophospholipase L1-like esterase
MRKLTTLIITMLMPIMSIGNSSASATEDPLKIMIVGDSISIGCSRTPMDGWCAELSTLLTQRNITHTISAHTIGGYSCSALSNGFAAAFDQNTPNVVIMNCGTNDAPNDQESKDHMGQQWRTMVEYSWTHGAHILPVFIQYSNPEINEENGRGWLLPGEGNANDVIYTNMQYYTAAGWFVGLADLQKVPGNWDYLLGGTDVIHPNPLGHHTYAAIFYRAMRTFYDWPDDVPEPCGMWGHREIYDPPAYIPCTTKS